MAALREGRHVSAFLAGRPPVNGPDGQPVRGESLLDGRLTLDYRGPLPELLAWLAEQQLSDLRVEPMGLAPIYKAHHATG